MAVMIQKIKEAVVGKDGDTIIRHYETDTDCVMMPDGEKTLSTFLVNFLGNRTIIVTGDATGQVSYRPVDEGTVELDIEVTDDSHTHTGGTICVGESGKVIVSGADKCLKVSKVTADELECLSGVRSNIQDQIDNLVTSVNVQFGGTNPPEDQSEGDLWFQDIPEETEEPEPEVTE